MTDWSLAPLTDATTTTAALARLDAAGALGMGRLDMVVSLTRNTKAVNWLGLPAVSLPCGFTRNGMPPGL